MGKAIVNWMLAPSEHSSDPHVQRDGITKTGNTYVGES